jgi:tetratricopeptide (TPR) repeat protein
MTNRENRYHQAVTKGHSAAWDQEWDKAANFYRQALDAKPDDSNALNSLALALYEMQEYEESLQFYLRVVEKLPQDPVSLEKVARIYEILNRSKIGSETAVRAAELYLKTEDINKAIENWTRAVGMNPEHLGAHSRLAVVYERLRRIPQSVREYLHIASLMQNAGDRDRAAQAVNRALRISPNNEEAQQALVMLRDGVLLPKPARPQGGTGPIRPPAGNQLEAPEEDPDDDSDQNPIEEAQSKALSVLATLFFEQTSEESEEQSTRRGLRSIVDGTGPLFDKNVDKNKLMLHLGQAVEALTMADSDRAAGELKQVIDIGLHHAGAYFSLGFLMAQSDRLESAMRNFKRAVNHADFSLASRLLMGQAYRHKGQVCEASIEFLEALSLADASAISRSQSDGLRQLYEPLIEAHAHSPEDEKCAQLCDTIAEMLVRPHWKRNLRNIRQQLAPDDGGPPSPIAQFITEASSSQVVTAMSIVRDLAREGRLQAAIEEALFALEDAPTYLPLHIAIGDLLVTGNQIQGAIDKFKVVARSYSVRGETGRAIDMLRRVIDMSPMDLAARSKLIDQLVERGDNEDAIKEYIKTAEVNYSLAELEAARKSYTRALRFAQQAGIGSQWSTRILHRVADIDVQSLNWRQALIIYQQICTLQPDDIEANRNLIDLNFRLGVTSEALSGLHSFVEILSKESRTTELINFLEKVATDWPQQPMVRNYLADQYQSAGRTQDAIAQLEVVGDVLANSGNKEGAISILQKMIAINPVDADKYQNMLNQISIG